jgi:hypothetical protein
MTTDHHSNRYQAIWLLQIDVGRSFYLDDRRTIIQDKCERPHRIMVYKAWSLPVPISRGYEQVLKQLTASSFTQQ